MRPRSISVTLDSQARYVLLGSLAEDRRVLDVGCDDARALQALAEGGASELTVVCAGASEVALGLEQAGIEGVEVMAQGGGPLPFADGSFDLVVCDDLAERLGRTPGLVQELRRVLDRRGTLALAIPNPDGQTLGALVGEEPPKSLGYQELYARLAPTFGSVTVLGQAPVVGSMFLDLSHDDEDAAVGLDPALLDGEQRAGWLVLLFSPEPVRPVALPIVPVPLASLAAAVRPAARGLASETTHAELAVTQQALERVVSERDVAVAERDSAFTQLGAIAAERDAALAESTALLAERDGLFAQTGTLAAQRDELSMQLAGVVSERDAALDQRGQLLADRDALASEHAHLSNERGTVLADLDGLLAEREVLAAERDALAARAATLEVERHEAREARDGLVGRLQELDAELAAQRSQAAQALARAEAFEKRFAEQAQAHDESLGRLGELENAAVVANARLDQLRALEQQADVHEEELRVLRQRQADELASRSVDLERTLAEERAARASVEAELAHARTESGALERQIRGLLEETTTLRRSLEDGPTPGAGGPVAGAPVAEQAIAAPASQAELVTAGAQVELAPSPPLAEVALAQAPAEAPLEAPPEAPLAPPLAPAAVVSDAGSGLDFELHGLPGAATFDVAAPASPGPVPPVAIADVPASNPTDSPADTLFGELQVGAAAPPKPRPVTLDDLEELLATSVPPTPRR